MVKYYEKAIKHLNRCLAINPSKAKAYNLLADIYLEQGLSDTAIEQINLGLSHSNDDELWLQKAKIEVKNGKWKEAYKSIKRIGINSKNNYEDLKLVLKIAEYQKDDSLCIKVLEKLISSEQEDYLYCLKLAELKQRNGLVEDARKFFDLALEMNRNNESCILKVVSFYLTCGDDLNGIDKNEITSFAIDLLSNFNSEKSHNFDIKRILIELYYKSQNFNKVYQIINDNKAGNFTSKVSLQILYDTYIHLGKQKEVHNYLKLAFKDIATRGEASFYLAKFYFIKKNKDAVKFSLNSIFYLNKRIISLSSEFESLKNSNDFYKAKICLSHINKHRNMISKSYLIYYQINLHLNKRLSSKALARFRYYKTF